MRIKKNKKGVTFSEMPQLIMILVLVGGLSLGGFVTWQALSDAFPDDEFYVSRDAAEDAVRQHGQFNVIHPKSGNKIDFMIAAANTWATNQLNRRKASGRSLGSFSCPYCRTFYYKAILCGICAI